VVRVVGERTGELQAVAPGRTRVWVEVGSRRDSAIVTVVAPGEVPVRRWIAVSSSRTGTCALDEQGQAFCWGDDFWGGWGTGRERRQFTHAHRPVRVNTRLAFEEIHRGLGFACARTSTGEVWCWGVHHGSLLGHGRTQTDFETGPVRVGFEGRATALSVGGQHACLLDEQGRAHCWGSNLLCQLGVGSAMASSAERGGRTVPVAFDGPFVMLSASGYFTCGLTPARELYCWGDVPIGSNFRTAVLPSPTRVPTSSEPRLVRAGNGNTCILTGEGVAECFGGNEGGQSGRSPDEGSDVPVAVITSLRFADLALSGGMTCGITAGGAAWCWGAGSAIDPAATRPCGWERAPFPCTGAPVPIAGGHRFASLSVGEATCGITHEGALYCWGSNEGGQLGIGRPGIRHTHVPQRVLYPL
jgi:alpha-tubulin suppressor-like RCC1 family protein